MNLFEATTDVRSLTRHDTDTRIGDPFIYGALNDAFREVRTWLQDVAPSLYLVTSGEMNVPSGGEISLSDPDYIFERLYRLDRKVCNTWIEVQRASLENPNQHQAGGLTFREEGGCLVIGPEGYTCDATFRMLFYETPGLLTTPDQVFKIPPGLERAIKFKACGIVALRDGDGAAGKAEWDKLAQEVLDAQAPILGKRYGVHTQNGGLRRVMGY